MKFYIASSTSRRDEVIKLQKQIVKKGHEVAFDWPNLHPPIKPYLKNQDLAKQYAIEDVDGIKNCDVFVLLISETPGIGSTTELGMAIALFELQGKPKIYIVGNRDHLSPNMFYFHPSVIYKSSFNEVLKDIKT
jgi:hypothetical protein